MALARLGEVLADMRGSIGGVCFQRTPAGLLAKRRTKPADRLSDRQALWRKRTAVIAHQWSGVLNSFARGSWRDIGARVFHQSRLGVPMPYSGREFYTRCNYARLVCGRPLLLTAPSITHPPIVDQRAYTTATVAGSRINVYFDTTLPWVRQFGGFFIVFASRMFGKGEHAAWKRGRFLGVIAGHLTSPPPSPRQFVWPQTLIAGFRYMLRCQILESNGIVSADFYMSGVVT